MQLAYLAVSLVILGGGKTPETQIIPQGYYDKAGCIEWKTNMDSQKRETVDPGSGRPLLSQQFICQPVDLDDMQRMIDSARQ